MHNVASRKRETKVKLVKSIKIIKHFYYVGLGCLVREVQAIRNCYMYSIHCKTLDLAPLLKNLGGRQE